MPTIYPVVDCPEHAQSALLMPSSRRFCFACGQEVLRDLLDPSFTYRGVADDALKSEARDAWNGSRVVRMFAASCQPGTTPLTTKAAAR